MKTHERGLISYLTAEEPWAVTRYNGRAHYIENVEIDWDLGQKNYVFACGITKKQVRFVKESPDHALNKCPTCKERWIELNRQGYQNLDCHV